MASSLEQRVASLLEGTGVTLNGNQPWDLQVHNPKLYARVLSEGSVGFGESYMDGWWDCDQIDELIHRIFSHNAQSKLRPSAALVKDLLLARLSNRQNQKRAFDNGQAHYDLGNDLYEAMLDRRLVYTCAYWKDAQNLDEAQEAKLDLVCRKIGLKPGQHVLDIGCGWGSFAKFAAEKYGARVTGITVAKEQVALGQELCKGLPVEIRLQDYRDVNEQFDHIISLGMFEHVGYKNFRSYFEVAHRCLKDNGVFLLHTIGGLKPSTTIDPWIAKYIFPGSMLPSASQISKAFEGLFVMEDWHNFGAYYDHTLMAWQQNFEAHWNELSSHYDERFRRMWNFYLKSCAGSFRARVNQLWQIVFTKNGVPGGYQTVR